MIVAAPTIRWAPMLTPASPSSAASKGEPDRPRQVLAFLGFMPMPGARLARHPPLVPVGGGGEEP